MANNTVLNAGSGGDTVRDVDRAGVKTPVCLIDVGGASSEVLCSAANPMPVSAAALPLPAGASTETTLAALSAKVPAALDASGGLKVAVVAGGGSGGTASSFGSAFPATGTAVGARDSTGANLAALNLDASGFLKVNVAAGGAGGGAVTQSGSWAVTANAGTNLNTSLLALESGGHLASVDGKLPALGQALAAASVPVVLTAAQLTAITPPTTVTANAGAGFFAGDVTDRTGRLLGHVTVDSAPTTAVTGTFWQATQPVSAASLPLPAGAATAANQATASTSLGSIDTKTPALGQALAAASVPVVLTAAQVTTLTPPATVTANLGALNGVAQDGADITTPTAMPAGGSGIRGWLSAIWTKLNGSLAVTGTFWQATQPVSGTFWQATQPVSLAAASSGGASVSSFVSTAAVQSTAVKASAGQVYGLEFFNTNASPRYVRLYDQTSAPASTDTPVWRGLIPGNTAGAGFVVPMPNGLQFASGIGLRVTGGSADNDATALAAGEVLGNVRYK